MLLYTQWVGRVYTKLVFSNVYYCLLGGLVECTAYVYSSGYSMEEYYLM